MKNASALLDDNDPIKLEAESKLNDLIRYVCFWQLMGLTMDVIERSHSQSTLVSARKTVCLSLVVKFVHATQHGSVIGSCSPPKYLRLKGWICLLNFTSQAP